MSDTPSPTANVADAAGAGTKPAQAPAATAISLKAAGWRERAGLAGYVGLVGPLWTLKEADGWAYGLLAGPQHLNPAGLVHGGLLTTLIDHALSAIAWEAVGRKPCVTVQLDTHFVAAAREGCFLEARGRVVRATTSLVFVQGAVRSGSDELVVATAVMKILGA